MKLHDERLHAPRRMHTVRLYENHINIQEKLDPSLSSVTAQRLLILNSSKFMKKDGACRIRKPTKNPENERNF